MRAQLPRLQEEGKLRKVSPKFIPPFPSFHLPIWTQSFQEAGMATRNKNESSGLMKDRFPELNAPYSQPEPLKDKALRVGEHRRQTVSHKRWSLSLINGAYPTGLPAVMETSSIWDVQCGNQELPQLLRTWNLVCTTEEWSFHFYLILVILNLTVKTHSRIVSAEQRDLTQELACSPGWPTSTTNPH